MCAEFCNGRLQEALKEMLLVWQTLPTTEPGRLRDSHRKGSGTCEDIVSFLPPFLKQDTEQTIGQIAAQATEQRYIKWGVKTQGTVM